MRVVNVKVHNLLNLIGKIWYKAENTKFLNWCFKVQLLTRDTRDLHMLDFTVPRRELSWPVFISTSRLHILAEQLIVILLSNCSSFAICRHRSVSATIVKQL